MVREVREADWQIVWGRPCKQRWSIIVVYSSSTLTFCRLKLLLNDHEEVLNVGGVIRHSVVLLIQLDV